MVYLNSFKYVSKHTVLPKSIECKIKDALSDSNLIIEYISNQIKMPWLLVLDTGDVSELQNSSEPFSFTLSRTYNYPDLIGILFPENKGNRTITFYLTSDCNLRCKYCYEACKDPVYLDIEDIDVFLDNLFTGKYATYFDLNEVGSLCMQFIGGEPLLCCDTIRHCINKYIELCEFADRYDLAMFTTYEITTNGVNYFSNSVQELIRDFPELSITVSLDGSKETHDKNRVFPNGEGSYDNAVKATLAELRRQSTYVPKMTISHDTITGLCSSLQNLYNLGIRNAVVNAALEQSYSVKECNQYLYELTQYALWLSKNNLKDFAGLLITEPKQTCTDTYCGGQGSMLTLGPGGKLYTCQRFMPSNCSCDAEDVSLGAIDNADFDVISKLKKAGTDYENDCLSCPVAGYCSHCPAIPYANTGKLSNKHCTNGCGLYLAQALAGNLYLQLTTGETWLDVNACSKLTQYFDKEVLSLYEFLR